MRAENGRRRAVAFFRVLGFAAILAGLFFAAGFSLRHFLKSLHSFEDLAFAGELIAAACTVIATIVMAGLTGRKFGDFGFSKPNWWRNLLIGFLAGIAFLAVQLAAMNALGVFSFGGITAAAAPLIYSALFCLGLFLAVGFTEEAMCRGYALVEMSRVISFWPAAILLSAIFGAAHLLNNGEDQVGAAVAFLFGIVLSYSFQQTGSLWLALGLHSGWDYAESFIFGVPNSGLVLTGRLLHPTMHGPTWLTGGSVGPEGSIFVAAPLLAFVLISRLLRRRQGALPR